MAQSMNCETHGEPGVLYLSTLQGEITTMVLCPHCMPDFITGWAVTLGLDEQWKAEIRGSLLTEEDSGELEWSFTGTKKEWDAAIKEGRAKWVRPAPLEPAGEQQAAQDSDQAPTGEAIDEQMQGT